MLLILALLSLTNSILSQTITNQFYNVAPANGNGLRFWSSDDYKIHMGNTTEYKFGPVTDYSIKNNMFSLSGRGFTWGANGSVPVAALEITTGDMQIKGGFKATGLHINGGTQFDGGVVFNGDVREANWNYKWSYNSTQRWMHFDFTNKMYFRNISNANISPLLLQSDGSVVINSQTNYGSSALYNTQGFKLAVNGGILCEEIKVILDVPQFDIVFEPDYELMSLYDTELYIKKFKHLPDFPSALEFKTNGYKLGEMDGLLLKKTEELTLHMIRIQKELDSFKLQTNLLEQKTTLLEEQVRLLKEENIRLQQELEIKK